MKHIGDVTKVDGTKVEPVHCITFGSPCQNLSVAGNRTGLAGSESGLFVEAVRIIKEMQEETNGEYPRFAVWENVPGAFSSNKGEDFRIVLEELVRIKERDAVIPRPVKWSKSGAIVGDGYSIAWRVLDAQYWGVPQRRKRIALVMDLGGQCASEILFECESMPGDSQQSISPWKGIARNPEGSTGECGAESRGDNVPPVTLKIRSGCEGGGKGALVQTDRSATLGCNNDQTLFVTERERDVCDASNGSVQEIRNRFCTETEGSQGCYRSHCYQKVTGALMANSHPGSYCGQDAYTGMLIVDEESNRG